jgi:hypothetical protein
VDSLHLKRNNQQKTSPLKILIDSGELISKNYEFE